MSKEKGNFEDYMFFFEQNVHFESREIMIGTPHHYDVEDHTVNFHIAANVIKAMILLERESKLPITLNLMTFGGCWNSTLAMYDVIRDISSRCTVAIKGMGAVMSAGPFLLQAASPGYRMLYPNTTIMLHDGGNGFDGHTRDFERWAEWSKKQRNHSYHLMAEHTGQKADFWRKKFANDWIITAQEAVEIGLADEIIGE